MNDLTKIMDFALIVSLRRYMRYRTNIHGQTVRNLRIFAMLQGFHVKNSIRIDFLKKICVTEYSLNPTFISVLSGKINTVYDLNEVLKDD